MKNHIYYILLFSTLICACKKNNILTYESDVDNISLNYLDPHGVPDTSAITYSFSETPGKANDTVWVPVRIAGKRIAKDRNFVLSVVDSMTTAKVNLHYEPLKPFYTIPADSGKLLVPVIIKNIDPALTDKTVVLGIRLVAGGDFIAGLPVSIRSKRIIFSNRLEQPVWWAWWQGNLGTYSRTAHQLYLISGGSALVDTRKPDAYLQIPRTLYYLENAKNFTRDPFTWVARNPEKGYVITKRTDGTQDYDFYNVNTPNTKIYVKFFPQVNSYFFMNENGNQIIMN
jgi:hypothetical protein